MVKLEELKRHIKERRIPMNQIAQALGISQSTLYRMLEADGKKFTVEQVKKLEIILSLKPAETIDIFLR